MAGPRRFKNNLIQPRKHRDKVAKGFEIYDESTQMKLVPLIWETGVSGMKMSEMRGEGSVNPDVVRKPGSSPGFEAGTHGVVDSSTLVLPLMCLTYRHLT